MNAREKFILVAKMILAELPRRITIDFNTVAMVTASAGNPTEAPAWPTVVIPVRMGSSPVIKLARPAVQLASA